MGNVIENTMKKLLKHEGFIKKRLAWYKKTDHCSCLVELQKSQWSDQYYINIAVAYNELNPPEFPKEYQCHIRGRLSKLIKNPELLGKCMDLEDDSISDELRESEIRTAIKDNALPILIRLCDWKSAKQFIDSDESKHFAISMKLKKAMGTSDN